MSSYFTLKAMEYGLDDMNNQRCDAFSTKVININITKSICTYIHSSWLLLWHCPLLEDIEEAAVTATATRIVKLIFKSHGG